MVLVASVVVLVVFLCNIYYFFTMFLLPAGSFAFEVSLRKSVRLSLIAVSGSVHKDRLKQCHVRRPLLA